MKNACPCRRKTPIHPPFFTSRRKTDAALAVIDDTKANEGFACRG